MANGRAPAPNDTQNFNNTSTTLNDSRGLINKESGPQSHRSDTSSIYLGPDSTNESVRRLANSPERLPFSPSPDSDQRNSSHVSTPFPYFLADLQTMYRSPLSSTTALSTRCTLLVPTGTTRRPNGVQLLHPMTLHVCDQLALFLRQALRHYL